MITKRLYVGGLSHNISEKDLKDRFGKFGEVSDIEVVTRKDEHGNPVKTFGYININISDAELKRCMTVLNKSKWKGGTLQIEMAKESFLHRLAAERQQAAENAKAKTVGQTETLVDSMKKAGVENFHMKAAVPGTEIPGLKDWTVSKFGRVLPVLNLKCEGKSKIFKYDPSKHCHNIKKLDTMMDVTEFTPVSQLTWEIPGGDDEISKKRRGEFPPQKPKPKKIKHDLSSPMGVYQRNSATNRLDMNNFERLSHIGEQKTSPLDSSKEMMVTKEASQMTKETDDSLEVVGSDFIVKSSTFQRGESENPTSSGNVDDEEYDSADTDEILTRSKPSDALDTEVDKYSEPGSLNEDVEESESEESGNLESDSSIDSDYAAMMTNCCRLEISFGDLEMLAKRSSEVPEEEDVELSSKPVSAPPPKKKCINPEDILASILGTHSSEDESEAKKPERKKSKKKSSSSLPAFMGTKDLFEVPGATEQELTPSIQMHNSVNEQKPPKTASQSEQCTSEVQDEIPHVKCSVTNTECIINPSVIVSSTITDGLATEPSNRSEEENVEEELGMAHSALCSEASPENTNEERSVVDLSTKQDQNGIPESSSSSCEDMETNLKNASCSKSQKATEELSSSSSSGKDCDQTKYATELEVVSSKKEDEESRAPLKTPVPLHTYDAEKQRQDNEKRLAALEQRQRESAQQKKLIQGALAVVDTPNAHKGKHIVFDSDNDSEPDEEEVSCPSTIKGNDLLQEDSEDTSRKTDNQQPKTSGACKLFDSSEEEDDDDSEEGRFQLKPQFEGKAGQKLMELQSRFGADERFQMNSRFMESEDEEEEQDDEQQKNSGNESHEEKLVEEKKKNLEILQSVLNISKPVFAESTKSKIFRDISTLHYDPTREDHAAFEKSKEPKTEGKAARRKKLAEAQKLPEVSKEIFYDVAVDLKEVFGSSATTAEGEKDISWDKEEEAVEEKREQSQTPDGNTDAQSNIFSLAAPETVESTGFKFSFFGEDTETVTDAKAEKDEYKIEPLKGPKLSWHADPRFQDSSSEDEDTEENEGETQAASVVAVEDLKPSKKTLFFFYQDDDRLKEGPRLFCRPAKLEDQREEWEEQRSSLIEEYRKKHKAARKKLRESHHN